MNQENILPVEAKEKADGVYSVALSRVEQRGEDPYGEMGDKMLNGQQDYCRALREVEGVRVAEIKAWWDGPGVLRAMAISVVRHGSASSIGRVVIPMSL